MRLSELVNPTADSSKRSTAAMRDGGRDGADSTESLLSRMYRTKLAWVTVAVATVGVGILVLGIVSSDWKAHRWSWIHDVPLESIGSTFLSTALVIVLFEYLGHNELEDRAIARLRHVLPEQEAVLRKAILDGFAFDPTSISSIASDQAIDAAVTNCLAIRLKDPEIASEVYHDVRQQVVKASERWHDVQVQITLGKADIGPEHGSGSMFRASLKWRFRTKVSVSELNFACVGDISMYRKLLGDAVFRQVWYFESVGNLTAKSPDVFRVSGASVNGHSLHIEERSLDGSRCFSATGVALSESRDQEVLVEYSYDVLVQRNSHLVVVDIAQPSKSVTASLMYADCGIKYVNVLDFFAGPSPARISRSSNTVPIHSVDASFDGWVFPKSGVAFVWVLEEEFDRKGR